MSDRPKPTWRLRRELRRTAQNIVEGRKAFENHFQRTSDKPLSKIEIDPRDLLDVLDEFDWLQSEMEEMREEELR